jgi:cytoskeletal protein RodZ
MNAQKKKLDAVRWIGIFVFAFVALMIAMLLYEAISGRNEYEAEQRSELSASAPSDASSAAGASGVSGADTASDATPAAPASAASQ